MGKMFLDEDESLFDTPRLKYYELRNEFDRKYLNPAVWKYKYGTKESIRSYNDLLRYLQKSFVNWIHPFLQIFQLTMFILFSIFYPSLESFVKISLTMLLLVTSTLENRANKTSFRRSRVILKIRRGVV